MWSMLILLVQSSQRDLVIYDWQQTSLVLGNYNLLYGPYTRNLVVPTDIFTYVPTKCVISSTWKSTKLHISKGHIETWTQCSICCWSLKHFLLKYFFFHFDTGVIEDCPWWSNRQNVSVGPGNGLAQNMRQAITWTNDDLVRWRIYASTDFNGLRRRMSTGVNSVLYIFKNWLLSRNLYGHQSQLELVGCMKHVHHECHFLLIKVPLYFQNRDISIFHIFQLPMIRGDYIFGDLMEISCENIIYH